MRNSLGSESITEVQLSSDEVLHARQTMDGKVAVDFFTDGEREFLLNDHRAYEEVHGEAAKAFADWQERSTLDLVKASGGKALPVGHELIDGRMATVYAWTEGEDTTVPIKVRVWIADDNFCPLQRENILREAVSPFVKGPYAQTDTATYSYDPDVQVKLPLP